MSEIIHPSNEYRDDEGYADAMESGDSEQVEKAMEDVHNAQDGLRGLATQPLNVAEGTKYGVDVELEAAADKILAEAEAKETSASDQEAPAAPAPEVAAEAPAVESPAPTPATTETPVAEIAAEQPAAEAPAPIAPENTNIDLAGTEQEARSAEKKIECLLPDGSQFIGTPAEYNEAVKDYLDSIA